VCEAEMSPRSSRPSRIGILRKRLRNYAPNVGRLKSHAGFA
jgi:hypothetical protein